MKAKDRYFVMIDAEEIKNRKQFEDLRRSLEETKQMCFKKGEQESSQ